ncbi:MAG: potassium channel family protein, partial [Coriobacteriia bacterium]|nr:potassium channel family protein [Coriobacteriia bacterium]
MTMRDEAPAVTATAAATPKMLLPRVLWQVIRAAGLMWWAVGFIIVYVIAVFLVNWAEPGFENAWDAAWLMFQVVTTIGLGDYTCVTAAGRVATVVLSLYSVFFLALLTGAVVSFCTESMRARRGTSVAEFIDQLERLPELN